MAFPLYNLIGSRRCSCSAWYFCADHPAVGTDHNSRGTIFVGGRGHNICKWLVSACKPLLFNFKYKWDHEIKPRTSVNAKSACQNTLIGFGGRITLDLWSCVILPPIPTHVFCQADLSLTCSWLNIKNILFLQVNI